jgi:hypothetical protein
MKKVKVADATGIVLDWLVAVAEGKHTDCQIQGGNIWYGRATSGFVDYRPHSNWAQGGPIIERERIQVAPLPDKGWRGHWRSFAKGDPRQVWMDCWDEGLLPSSPPCAATWRPN